MRLRKEYEIKCNTTKIMCDKVKERLMALEEIYNIVGYSFEIYNDDYNLLIVIVNKDTGA